MYFTNECGIKGAEQAELLIPTFFSARRIFLHGGPSSTV